MRRRLREAAFSGAAAGTVALTAAILATAGIVWRGEVVRVAPATQTAYALLGLPVNRVGLVIEDVRAEPTLQNGRAALAVLGSLRNVAGRAAPSPPLRIVLFNAEGAPVASRIAAPAALRIPAGGTRRFAVAILDPPLAAHDLVVSFATRRRERTAPRAPALAAEMGRRMPLDLKGPIIAGPPSSAGILAAPTPPGGG